MSETNTVRVVLPPAEAPLGSNHLLNALAPDDFALLAPHLDESLLERGTVLQEPGARIDRVYFPNSGLISLVRNAREDPAIDTATIGCEGAIGLSAGLGSQIALGAAIVLMPGRAAHISPPRLIEAAARSTSLRDMIVRYSDVLLAQVQQVVVCNTWLVQASDRVGDTLALTQEHLAGLLGVQRTTVTMICRRLQAEGILNVRRGRIIIRDPAALEAKSCDCVRITRGLMERRPRPLSH